MNEEEEFCTSEITILIDESSSAKRLRVDLAEEASNFSFPIPPMLQGKVNIEELRAHFRTYSPKQLMSMATPIWSDFGAKLEDVIERMLMLEERNVVLVKDLAAAEAKLEESEKVVAFERALADEGQRLMKDCYEKKMEEHDEELAALEERSLAFVKESLEAKHEAGEAKLVESERLVAYERALADEGQRLMKACYEKKMEELCAENATRLKEELEAVNESRLAELEVAKARLVVLERLAEEAQMSMEDSLAQHKKEIEELRKAADIRLKEASDEGRLQGFNTCREQFQNLGRLPEEFDFSFLNSYADGMGRLDADDGAGTGSVPSEAAVMAHLIKEAVLSMELRKKFLTALEPLFGKLVEVDAVFSRSAIFQASAGRFTFLVHFSLSLQFPEHQPELQLESSEHFTGHGAPVKSPNLTEYPWNARWEASEMAGQIFDFVAEEGLNFKKYCNHWNQQ